MDLHSATAFCFAISTACFAAFSDARTGLIPNWLSLGSLGLAFLWHAGLWQAESTALALGGFASGASAPLLLYLFSRGRAIGGGDVKLLAALGAWLGPELILYATLSGSLLLLLYAFATRRREGIRMGPGLCAGTLLACSLELLSGLS